MITNRINNFKTLNFCNEQKLQEYNKSSTEITDSMLTQRGPQKYEDHQHHCTIKKNKLRTILFFQQLLVIFHIKTKIYTFASETPRFQQNLHPLYHLLHPEPSIIKENISNSSIKTKLLESITKQKLKTQKRFQIGYRCNQIHMRIINRLQQKLGREIICFFKVILK